ncbi:class I SAM-dependent methyltransferase [bacterium]|nr:class I SAM-dependent methyltransferase [bacterium]
MIYSHYSEYMAHAMSAARPGPDPGEWDHLLPYFQSNEEPFLELACGYGRLLLPIMEAGYRIVGTDSSPEMLNRCRELAEARNLEPVLQNGSCSVSPSRRDSVSSLSMTVLSL